MGVTPDAQDRLSQLRARVRSGGAVDGLFGLGCLVAAMWIVQAVNALDDQKLSLYDGLFARSISHLWGIVTCPFLHASWAHLEGNTLPLLFLGALVAIRGLRHFSAITIIVIVVGGLGTWLISPSTSNGFRVDTVGASGLIFGYAGYLLARGVIDHRLVDLALAAVVTVLWGAALLSSLLPHQGVSWQGHLCGGLTGIWLAWMMSDRRARRRGRRGASAAVPTPP
ncbi:MAG: rhomboid family intramembrane serine protease [Solirubrobacterales bacterium]|nr:rhomboid family intramembrane serine protease [Solirubrobacterales bacterium]